MGKLLKSICLLVLGNSHLLIRGIMSSATFTFVNKCEETVWPGISSSVGTAPFQPTGFALQKGEAKVLSAPSSWGGQVWRRTHCSEGLDGKFSCGTGDCGYGKLECAGSGATPPATLAEFTVGGMDFFHISLVGGYNLPMMVAPSGGSGHNCASTGCMVVLNNKCPSALKVMNSDGEVVACKSACVAFGQQEDCCRGVYGSPETCKPSFYSQVFKIACPSAFSYAYDDKTTIFTCTGADYLIIFGPQSTT